MPKQDQHSDQFYLDLLNQYVQGSISKENLHLLEKRALDDPFLGDALEGYYHQDKSLSRKHLMKMSTSENEKISSKIVSWRPWLAVAASLLLLLTFTFILKDNDFGAKENNSMVADTNSSENDQTYADLELQDEKLSTEVVNNKNPIEEKESTAASPPLSKINLEPTKAVVKDWAKQEEVVVEEKNLDIVATESEVIPRVEKTESQDSEDEEMAASEPEMKNKKVAIKGARSQNGEYVLDGVKIQDSAEKEGQVLNYVTGKVEDVDNLPLIGANVVVKRNNEVVAGAVTDLDGNYQISELDTGVAELEVVYTGYEAQRYGNAVIVPGVNNYDFKLEEGAMLDEVVVTSLGKDTKQSDQYMPEMGYEAFAEYINDARGISQSDFGGPAEILLQFEIQTDGSIEKIKVIESNNPSKNDEAILLLQEGGLWKVNKPANPPFTATYRMVF